MARTHAALIGLSVDPRRRALLLLGVVVVVPIAGDVGQILSRRLGYGAAVALIAVAPLLTDRPGLPPRCG